MLTKVEPVTGWMLDLAVALDVHAPGFAAAFLGASNEKRQVIAAFCARRGLSIMEIADAAQLLRKGRHRTILSTGFGDVPQGFRGALGRSGAQPHDPRYYRTLHRMLTKPAHARIVPTINGLQRLDFQRLRILAILPQDLCSPSVVSAVHDSETAKSAIKVADLLVKHGVDRGELTSSIRAAKDGEQLAKLWKRWAVRCRLPDQPIAAMQGYRPIETAADLHRMARRYRNCGMHYLIEALDGHSAFAEFLATDDGPGMVAHIRRRNGLWEVEDLFRRNNARPSLEQRLKAYAFFASAGILQRERERTPEGPWSSLRRLTSSLNWDFEDFNGLP